tara:strand:- start:48 stop:230 length:183 start_codon:yes stop_codon:yes gene_type:complete
MNNHQINDYFENLRKNLHQIQMRIEESKYQNDSLHDAMCDVDDILLKMCKDMTNKKDIEQ